MCGSKSECIGTCSLTKLATNKYACRGITAEGRNDLVGEFAPFVQYLSRAWETFPHHRIPGFIIARCQSLQISIDGCCSETFNKTRTHLLFAPVRKCDTSIADMQWKVVRRSCRGENNLLNLHDNQYVRVVSNALLKASSAQGQATFFIWKRYCFGLASFCTTLQWYLIQYSFMSFFSLRVLFFTSR